MTRVRSACRLLSALLVLAATSAAAQPPGPRCDLLFAGGRVVDGTGAPWFRGDVCVVGDRIAAVGRLEGATARRRIDATGLVVAPGFIDMLGQSEYSLLVDPRGPEVDRGSLLDAPRPWAVIANGPPRDKVDLLLMGDGYTAAEMDKWHRDARRLAEELFAVSPFKERRADFNVWAVDTPAVESGAARPTAPAKQYVRRTKAPEPVAESPHVEGVAVMHEGMGKGHLGHQKRRQHPVPLH